MSLEYRFDSRGTGQLRQVGSDKKSPCWYILGALLAVLAVAGIWLLVQGYLLSTDSSGSHALSLRGKIDEQNRLLEQQTATIKQLEEQVASSKREQQVQVVANEELSQKLAASVADLATEREKLVLYESILAPADLEQGLYIQHFGIKPRLVDGEGKKVESLYQYHLVLANVKSGETVLDGSYSITFSGKQGGKTVTVSLKEVTPTGEKFNDAFSVKHYQSLEGSFSLPKDFTPDSVKLKVSPASGVAQARLTQNYDWATFKDSNASTKKE